MSIQEVPRTSERKPTESIYLWSVDLPKLHYTLLDVLHQVSPILMMLLQPLLLSQLQLLWQLPLLALFFVFLPAVMCNRVGCFILLPSLLMPQCPLHWDCIEPSG